MIYLTELGDISWHTNPSPESEMMRRIKVFHNIIKGPPLEIHLLGQSGLGCFNIPGELYSGFSFIKTKQLLNSNFQFPFYFPCSC